MENIITFPKLNQLNLYESLLKKYFFLRKMYFYLELPPSKKIETNHYSLEPDMIFGFFLFYSYC